jgi:hypothetical protein
MWHAVANPPILYISRCDTSPLPANSMFALDPWGVIAEK